MSESTSPERKRGINRREFIAKVGTTSVVAAATVADVLAATSAPPVRQGSRKAQPQASQPVEVEGRPQMPEIRNRVEHASGIPLGGIGTGSVEIRPDGYFHEWQIFNTGGWAPSQPEHERGGGPEMGPGALSFFLRTQQGKDVKVRRLGTREDQNNLYSLAWVKNVEEIVYEGRFPVAKLRYVDGTMPVAVSAHAFSPFVPHDAQTSGTPGFTFAFELENTSRKPIEVSLTALLENPVAWGAEDRRLSQTVTREGEATYLTMRTGAQTERMSSLGSLSLSVAGGKASWIAGDFRRYLSNGDWMGGAFGNCHESFLREYRIAGKLPSLAPQLDPHTVGLGDDDQIRALSDSEKARLVSELRMYASFAALAARIERVDPKLLQTGDGMARYLMECRNRMGREDRWGDCALASSVSLAPGERKTVRFALGWFFPHHFSEYGPEMGHRYEQWFSDAEAVNRFLVAAYEEHRQKAEAFSNALYDTSLGSELSSAWSSQLTTLVKCTWWTKNGKFAVWEGLGCCGFHTMDITYQGSFGILALFPELQKGQMAMGTDYQRADGRVAHFFTPDLSHVDNGFDRVDMNPQFVMLACRDYLWTGDTDYLKRVWPHVLRAMANTALLDADGDGLPDHDTRRNTYDAWEFFGTPSYISSLWLGALRAGVRMASDLGENSQAAEWSALLSKGAESFPKKLWNGEYFSLWADIDARDECCMSDQMSGEWFTHLIGIGHGLPKERVLAAMKAIVKHNFDPESGLVNATYPADKPARFTTYQNGQATANWTGVEYAIGSMMIDFGMVQEGLAVVRSIYDRYARAGRNWNHVECGDHYYRAMCSWATLLAATGFKVDVPRHLVEIVPPIKQPKLTAPWFSSTGWGSFTQTANGLSVSCKAGTLTFKSIVTALKARSLTATLAGATLPCKAVNADGRVAAEFPDAVTLSQGQTLALTV
jgi:uncharacterized protein (DUF608 family)